MSPPALTSIARLRRVLPWLDTGDADARWMAARLKEYFDTAELGAALDAVLDLAPAPGGVTWFEVEQRASARLCGRDVATGFALEGDGGGAQSPPL